ncbi:MAG TPA: glycosyltransferase, partial [Nodosilinea sp.]|nr:glycosyltransferase [Nodosilinea sp.]
MTTYNRERYVGAAIASVLAQTYPHFELVVWDDGSMDNTVAIARSYADRDRRVKVVAAPHQGRVASLNAAMDQTHGTYLGLVDSDDLLAPTALADTAAVLDAQPKVEWLYTDHLLIDPEGQPLGYDPRRHIPYSPLGLLVDFMTFHFRLMRRSLFDRVGGFVGSPDYAEDYDLCLRLAEISAPYHLQKTLYFYRHHGGNISQRYADRQLNDAQQAVERAIQRRGLADQLTLTVEDRRFRLRGRLKQPTLPPWRACLSPPIARPVGTVLASLSLSSLAIGEAQALVAPSPGQLRQTTVTNPVSAAAESILPAARPTAPDPSQALPRFAETLPMAVQLAQAIQPASDGTGTVVNQTGNQFEITGGQRSLDQTNLFHSFEQFNLTAEQAATFLSQPEIQNIVGRVVGGDPSLLNGLLQVLGGPSNLFLVNPAGLLVGPNVQLDIPGSLTLTSANALSFGNQWLPTTGPVDYSLLNGAPTGFTFLTDRPSPVVNTGNLSANPGAAVRLMGGTVVNTGTITAPGGEITLAAVPGSSTVRISQPGQI